MMWAAPAASIRSACWRFSQSRTKSWKEAVDPKIAEAKNYVAAKLKISVADLTNPVIMIEVRQNLQLCTMSPQARGARGIEAKFRIAEALGISINCVNRFRKKTVF
jgi:hypothetical protein